MLIVPELGEREFSLSAFSFSDDELASVPTVLKAAKIPFRQKALPKDRSGRKGIRYSFTVKLTSAFSEYLRVRITGFGAQTIVSLLPGEPIDGTNYKCEELVLGGISNQCVQIRARSHSEALVRCALEANRRNWLGGLTNEGDCPQR